jgi:NADH:ubiquinone oxidoreductase subunit E
MIVVTVCVGSSCHVKGAREILSRFEDFLAAEDLKEKVELRGSFCMDRCGEGINWEIDGEIINSASVEQAVETLRNRVIGESGTTAADQPEDGHNKEG